jgi:hypothetical protein
LFGNLSSVDHFTTNVCGRDSMIIFVRKQEDSKAQKFLKAPLFSRAK